MIAATMDCTGRTEIIVNGNAYQVVCDWNCASDFEEASGTVISDAIQDVSARRFSARMTRAMLWASLRTHHKELTLEDAGDLIGKAGRREAHRVLGVALRYYLPRRRTSHRAARSSRTRQPASFLRLPWMR